MSRSLETITHTETRSFAAEQAGRRLGRLAFQVNQTVKSRDAGAVHDLRVAIRRFSQVLRIFKSGFRTKEIRKIRRELKQTMKLAGEVRNCDIALKLLSKSKRTGAAALRPELEKLRSERERALVGFLRQWVNRKSSLKWRNAVATALTKNGGELSKVSIGTTATQILPRMAEKFVDRGNDAARTKASPRDLHQFRIASKRFRYTLELFTSVYGRSMNASLNKIKRVQKLLGDINDCETVRTMVEQYKGPAVVTAWLKKRQRRRIEEFQRYWAETFVPRGAARSWSAFLRRPAGSVQQVRKPAGRAGAAEKAANRSAAVA